MLVQRKRNSDIKTSERQQPYRIDRYKVEKKINKKENISI